MQCHQLQVIALELALFTLTQGQLTEQAINQRLSSEVVAPFQAGLTQYNALLSQMWDQLQGYDPESEIPIEIPESVKEHSDNFLDNLHSASNNSKSLQNDMFDLVAQKTEQVSAIEQDIEQQNDQIAKVKVQIQTSQNAVDLASTGLRNANSELANHRAALQEAEQRLHKAKHDCFGKGRRKRGFFGGFGDKFEVAGRKVYSGVCQGLGALTGKIDEEKRKVREAEDRVAKAQAHLNAKQSELKDAKTALTVDERRASDLQQQLTDTKTSLDVAQVQRQSLVATNMKMMKTVEFLEGMLAQGEAVSLTTELGYILDIDNVFNPLKDVSIDLQQLGAGGEGGFVPTISEEQLLQIEEIINKMNNKTKDGIQAGYFQTDPTRTEMNSTRPDPSRLELM